MIEGILEYAENHTTPEPAVLAKLNRETHLTQVYPQMISGHLQGTLLRMICHMIKPRRVLEIGTFTGYSAIALALGMNQRESIGTTPQKGFTSPPAPPQKGRGEGVVLHTLEVNPEFEERIRKYIGEAELEEIIVLHIGEALEIIPTLNESWDLVFIDADKPNYLNYYNLVFPSVRPGGWIIADNVLWDGKVIDNPAKMDKDTRGIFEFNEFIQNDDRVENLLLPIRDGLMVIRKKSETL